MVLLPLSLGIEGKKPRVTCNCCVCGNSIARMLSHILVHIQIVVITSVLLTITADRVKAT